MFKNRCSLETKSFLERVPYLNLPPESDDDVYDDMQVEEMTYQAMYDDVMMLMILSQIFHNLDICLEIPSFRHGLPPLLLCIDASLASWIVGENSYVKGSKVLDEQGTFLLILYGKVTAR